MNTSFDMLSLHELRSYIRERKLPSFRAQQIIEWVYKKGVLSYQDMTNLPQSLRDTLTDELPFNTPTITDKQISQDGARKYILTFSDGTQVETVAIPSHEIQENGEPKHLTVCVSSQVGCPMKCAFCATGNEGFTRNLFPGEIVQQVLTVQRDFCIRVSHVVVMGQGEGFLNFDNLISALNILREVCGIGSRHITVSTCGVLKGISQFSEVPHQYTLAVSLHSAIQSTRDTLMPRCITAPLDQLHSSIQQYYLTAKRRVTLEYLMIKGINDLESDLSALIDFCEGLFVHINLLPMNSIDSSPFQPSSKKTIQHWKTQLEQHGIETTIRNSRGSDIAGACGQLKNKLNSF